MRQPRSLDDEYLTIDDPTNGRRWRLPRRLVERIDAEVTERWVANVLVPPALLRAQVPLPFLQPTLVDGRGVLSLCAIFMRHAAPDWVPLHLTPASHNCALRIACTDQRDGSPAVWVDHRYSDSPLAGALTSLGFPAVLPLLRCHRDGTGPTTRRLGLETLDLAIDCRLQQRRDAIGSRLFADATAFEDYFGAGIRSYGPGSTADRCTVVDLVKHSDNHFQATELGGFVQTAWGRWPVESVYLTCAGRYSWQMRGQIACPA